MILVTGATGFLGSRLHRLLDEARPGGVIALGRNSAPGIACCDLMHPREGRVPWERIDRVVHCAAAIPSRGNCDPFVNVTLTQRLLEQLDPARLQAFVLLSSVAVYPISPGLPECALAEECSESPTDGYGQSKLAQEWLVAAFGRDRFPVTVLRPSSIYGNGNTSRTMLPVFVAQARAGLPLALSGPRRYQQNFVHVDDVASAAATSVLEGRAGVYNVFSRETLTPRQLAERIISHFGSASEIIDRQDDTPYPRLYFDNRRFTGDFERDLLGLEEGFRRDNDYE